MAEETKLDDINDLTPEEVINALDMGDVIEQTMPSD